jgi:hypothetical protein
MCDKLKKKKEKKNRRGVQFNSWHNETSQLIDIKEREANVNQIRVQGLGA